MFPAVALHHPPRALGLLFASIAQSSIRARSASGTVSRHLHRAVFTGSRHAHSPSSNVSLASKPVALASSRTQDTSFMPARHYSVVTPGIVTNTARSVPSHILKPPYLRGEPLPSGDAVQLKTSANDLDALRAACKIAKKTLDYAETLLRPGITTEEIDILVHEYIIKAGAYPSPLKYRGFPKSVCTSVNNVVCHGIPDDRPLEDGDIINVDVTVFTGDGFHGDTSATFAVGVPDEGARRLLQVARECRDRAVEVCGPHKRLAAIGAAVQTHAQRNGFSVCMEFVGHGIGRAFHEGPSVYHYANNHRGMMQPGMAFTIEPAINEGSRGYRILADGWTAVTADNGRSAQFEHTILITQTGYEVLTI